MPEGKPVVLLDAGGPRSVSGIVARRFARENVHVIITGSDFRQLEASAHSVIAFGGTAEVIETDFRSEQALANLLDTVCRMQPSIGAVVFNSNSNSRAPIPLNEMTLEKLDEYVRTGVYGAFVVAKVVMPFFAKQRSGVFLVTGVSANSWSQSAQSCVRLANSNLMSLVETLAKEYQPYGANVEYVGIESGEGAAYEHIEANSLPAGATPPIADAIAEQLWNAYRKR